MSEEFHPRRDPFGRRVRIDRPSQPSPKGSWTDPQATAVFIPDGEAPDALHGVPMRPWKWLDHQARQAFTLEDRSDDPPFDRPASLRGSAGVVCVEPDDRVWLVHPSNAFGGYVWTFPKGRQEQRDSLRGTAVKEAWEESGLHVEPCRFLVDCRRSTTYSRYYLARRLGGTPVAMCWESQAVCLVPRTEIRKLVTSRYDQVIVDAIESLSGAGSDLWR